MCEYKFSEPVIQSGAKAIASQGGPAGVPKVVCHRLPVSQSCVTMRKPVTRQDIADVEQHFFRQERQKEWWGDHSTYLRIPNQDQQFKLPSDSCVLRNPGNAIGIFRPLFHGHAQVSSTDADIRQAALYKESLQYRILAFSLSPVSVIACTAFKEFTLAQCTELPAGGWSHL
ncbi:hypothetical protein DFH06DRAFT_1134477 [Mycena polygramma]|nr:hypothetical protein DFH06DRAFT_1134477 [Mycena polygramma]